MSDARSSSRHYTYFIIREPDTPDRILVFDTQDISVGRSNENDLQAQYAEMSRHHATLIRSGTECTVQNLSNSSCTLVNGASIQSHTLQNKDVIEMAELKFTFVEGTDNPASLGMKTVYASQLKGFGPAGAQDADAEATILGIPETGAEDDAVAAAWEVQPPGDFEYDLQGIDKNASKPRDLDLELKDFALDDLGLPDADNPESIAPAKPLPRPAPPKPVAAPPAAAAKPAPQREVRAPKEQNRRTQQASQRVSLHLEIEGLTPELRAVVNGLQGKVISLPALRFRIKEDDLD